MKNGRVLHIIAFDTFPNFPINFSPRFSSQEINSFSLFGIALYLCGTGGREGDRGMDGGGDVARLL